MTSPIYGGTDSWMLVQAWATRHVSGPTCSIFVNWQKSRDPAIPSRCNSRTVALEDSLHGVSLATYVAARERKGVDSRFRKAARGTVGISARGRGNRLGGSDCSWVRNDSVATARRRQPNQRDCRDRKRTGSGHPVPGFCAPRRFLVRKFSRPKIIMMMPAISRNEQTIPAISNNPDLVPPVDSKRTRKASLDPK